MKAYAVPLLRHFEKKMRLEVPLLSTAVRVNREAAVGSHFWEDISRKFSEYLEGRKDAPFIF